jgi:hypothetical protein
VPLFRLRYHGQMGTKESVIEARDLVLAKRVGEKYAALQSARVLVLEPLVVADESILDESAEPEDDVNEPSADEMAKMSGPGSRPPKPVSDDEMAPLSDGAETASTARPNAAERFKPKRAAARDDR